MNLRKLLFISALAVTVSAVSCGKDNENTVSSVEFSLNESSATEETTEATTETEETTTTAVTTTGTETTTTATDTTTETTAESTTTETSTTKKTTKTARTTTIPRTNNNENSNNISDGNENNSTSDNVDDNNEQQQDSQPQDTTAPDDTQQGEENTTEPDTTEPVTEPQQNSLQFSLDNLLSNASGIISSLGTPDYEGVSPACTSNGKDVKTYQYKGLEIQCYVDGGSEYIFSIEITENIHSTDKGITVGSSRAEVETAYGTGTESGGYTVYESTADNVTREIDIKYSGDTVVSVIFYTPV
ncbi:MAG: hypothetical protein K2J08_09480 [Ruminococcus sp.]|nr:hypothetical protein [Ruminococcus sp.]